MYLIFISILGIIVSVVYSKESKTRRPYLSSIVICSLASCIGFILLLLNNGSEYQIWTLFFVGIPLFISSILSITIIALMKKTNTPNK